MAFTIFWSNGTHVDYDNNTHFEVDGGVLKLGAVKGKWTTYYSPSVWASIQADPPNH